MSKYGYDVIMSTQVELYVKHDGESTMAATRDFLHKGMAGNLVDGWSILVLEALKENQQQHLSELCKPSKKLKKITRYFV